jgi:hypothetical protein
LKKILVLFILMAFTFTAALVEAKEAEKVKCCVTQTSSWTKTKKHRCVETSKSDCKKIGKVVKECEDCK